VITFPNAPGWLGLGWIIALVVLIIAIVLLVISQVTPMALILMIIGLALARLL
jgi:hypothetical protein